MFIVLSITNFDFLTKFYEIFNFNYYCSVKKVWEAWKRIEKKLIFLKIVIFLGKKRTKPGTELTGDPL